ncbi:MAG TPA: sigma-70 family RNA polymerase sigma factor [Vicinamibacteria bacterium]|nr:sigma-70 family RNA polymerase sigma factor [Vicinamibacteria bacterium]
MALARQVFDAVYLERLRGGDRETGRHFYAYFAELILIKVRARQRSSSFAEDVLQETLVRVLRVVRSQEGLRDPGSLGAFVSSVCNNVLLEFGRAEGRHRPPLVEPAPLPDPTPNQEMRLITEERKHAVRRVIDGLPPKDRELLRAVFLAEHEKDVVCQQLGVSRDYLRVLIHRAKNQFRALYLQQEQGPASHSEAGRRPSRRSVGG